MLKVRKKFVSQRVRGKNKNYVWKLRKTIIWFLWLTYDIKFCSYFISLISIYLDFCFLLTNFIFNFETQVQSVIQPNQQSVIQTATNIQPVALSKGNVILVKPNSVIQTTGGLQTLQVINFLWIYLYYF